MLRVCTCGTWICELTMAKLEEEKKECFKANCSFSRKTSAASAWNGLENKIKQRQKR